MKRFPEVVSFCCIMIWVLVSGTAPQRTQDTSYDNLLQGAEHDTTGFTGLLKVDSFKLSVIPPSSGIRFYRDGIVFLSNSKYEGKMLPKHVSFGSNEAYTAILKDSTLGMHMLFSPSSPFSFPCDAITFSSDYKTMYYTRIAKKDQREKIYRATLKPDNNNTTSWIPDPNPLDFCTGDNIYTHPALSDDGRVLIFCSDMRGTIGSMDLFIVRKEGEKWTRPENLGRIINTAKDECFPFIDRDNNLYYSSNGLDGFGGYDIYTCKFNGTDWEKPVNLSGRINTRNDEIAFSTARNGLTGFFTGRQVTGKFDMQLFRVSLKQDSLNNKLLTISYLYNGEMVPAAGPVAMKTTEEIKQPAREPEVTIPVEVKKEEPKPEVKPETKKVTEPPPVTPKAPEAKVVEIKSLTEIPEELRNVVVYRIQFLSTSKPRAEKHLILNGVTYPTYEYFYLNAYRYTIGEFTTLGPAKELQSLCRKAGYPQAFVAAFKNNTRSLDLALFR